MGQKKKTKLNQNLVLKPEFKPFFFLLLCFFFFLFLPFVTFCFFNISIICCGFVTRSITKIYKKSAKHFDCIPQDVSLIPARVVLPFRPFIFSLFSSQMTLLSTQPWGTLDPTLISHLSVCLQLFPPQWLISWQQQLEEGGFFRVLFLPPPPPPPPCSSCSPVGGVWHRGVGDSPSLKAEEQWGSEEAEAPDLSCSGKDMSKCVWKAVILEERSSDICWNYLFSSSLLLLKRLWVHNLCDLLYSNFVWTC